MTTLNRNHRLTAHQLSTFKGLPEKILLPRGKRLFKLSTYHPINSRRGGEVTEYWADQYASLKGDWGWDGLQRMVNHLNVSEKELVRLSSAIKLEWNDLDWVWFVELKEDVYGWHGHTANQHKTGDRGVRLTGMNMQYLIPNLAGWHISVLRSVRAH